MTRPPVIPHDEKPGILRRRIETWLKTLRWLPHSWWLDIRRDLVLQLFLRIQARLLDALSASDDRRLVVQR